MDNPLNFIRTPIEGCNTLVISGPITVPKLFEIKELYQRLDLPKIVIMFGNALSECSLHEQYLGVSVSALDIKVNYWISGSPPEREHLIEVFRSI